MPDVPLSFGRFHTALCFFVGFIIACAFTFLLNVSSIRDFAQARLTFFDLGFDNVSADEAHYFAMIRDVADGLFNLGNTSLQEHQSDPNVSTYAPLLQGSLIRFFDTDFTMAILIGDVLFPFLGVLILFIALSLLGFSLFDAALMALFSLSAIGWQRSINPQISIPLFLFATGAFFIGNIRPSKRGWMLQGALTAVLIFVHVLYAELLLAAELCVAFFHYVRTGEAKRRIFVRLGCTVAPSFVAFVVKVLLTAGLSPDVLSDTYRRLGMIPSHLPAAPMLQLQIALTLAIVFVLRRRKLISENAILESLSFLLIATLLCLNQSIVSGVDLVFGLYFAVPAAIFLRLLWMSVILSFIPIPLRVRRILAVLIVAFSLLPLMRLELQEHSAENEAARMYAPLIAWLVSEPGDKVILAPIEIANLIPIVSSHSVVFNQYAHFGSASDEELADRFLLEKSLFPIVREEGDPLFSWVFGLYAGNLSARSRTACRLFDPFVRDACTNDPRSFVFHQDQLRRLEAGTVGRKKMLEKFNVDFIISETELSPDLLSLCPFDRTVAAYRVHRCGTLVP